MNRPYLITTLATARTLVLVSDASAAIIGARGRQTSRRDRKGTRRSARRPAPRGATRRDLQREMGIAIGREAQAAGVAVVLGPGASLKRNPLCGRNFEYFSEDPFLSGELAASWILGLQSQGVGAALKHFAANNQETERMASDSLVDERALGELYLPAFETAVRQARPAAVMSAYNKLNGVYCSDHHELLRRILRDEWGFEGVLLTDWGGMNDRLRAFEAGLDLEMPGSGLPSSGLPGSGGYFDA